jgi:hypothetical protein
LYPILSHFIQKTFRHGDICTAVLPPICSHSPLLSQHLLQASKQQKEIVQKQKFEEENQHREVAEKKDIDEPDVGVDGESLKRNGNFD